MRRCTVRAHAKINLNLRVVDVRPDGYHALQTVFQSLLLHDTLRFEPVEGPLRIVCDAPGVPLDERNLVWRAAQAVWLAVGRAGAPRDLAIRLVKRIPAQGGLGGGSADGAAALVALDALWEARLGRDRLVDLAASLGADVPFFLCAGTALGLGRGDHVYPLIDLPRRYVVLVHPPFGVATADAFGWFDRDDEEARLGERTAERAASRPIAPGSRLRLGPTALDVENDLERPVSRRRPEIGRIRACLEACGAEAAAMTGSGSTVFGLFDARETAMAAVRILASEGWAASVTRTATRGQAAIVPTDPTVVERSARP